MSVRLQSFQYLPRGADGWASRLLHFGEMFTAVQGPNGTGKTPIMKGVIQGLGHEVELPPDVLTRCEFAETTLAVDGRPVTLTRRLGEDFEIRVADREEKQVFTSQAEYARWFIGLFCAEPPLLTDKRSQESQLYATVLLPALWVDQIMAGPPTTGQRRTAISSRTSGRRSSDFSSGFHRGIPSGLGQNSMRPKTRSSGLSGPSTCSASWSTVCGPMSNWPTTKSRDSSSGVHTPDGNWTRTVR
jgi:hypothetical protein